MIKQTATQEVEAKLRDMFSDCRNRKNLKDLFRELDHESKLMSLLLAEMLTRDFLQPLGLEIYHQLRVDVKRDLSAGGAVQVDKGVDEIGPLQFDQQGDAFYRMDDMCDLFNVVPQTIRRWCREGKIPHPDFPGSIHERSRKKLWRLTTILEGIEETRKIKNKGLRRP